MYLTASPFDTNSGELLDVYRDAYLRGDLAPEHTLRVDAHLKKNATLGSQTWQRFHVMQQTGEQVQAVGWMQSQMHRMRTSPQRMRRQALAAVVGLVLVGGAVFAGTSAPGLSADGSLAPTSTTRMATVRGKILDENGRPLVGATVFEKSSSRGVSTDANGEYTLAVPADRSTTLAYGYGGYTDEEIRVSGHARALDNVTLVPSYEVAAKPARKARHWFFFN